MKRLIFLLSVLLLSCSLCVLSACSPKHTHSFTEYSTIVAADCNSEGVMTRKCKDCGFTEVKTLPQKEHSYSVVSKIDATCVSDGLIIEKCSLCGADKVTVEDKLNHLLSDNIIEADCYKPKTIVKTCSRCDFTLYEEVGEPLEHEFELLMNVRGNCGEVGKSIFVCSLCNFQRIEQNDIIYEHVYETVKKVDATCVEDGLIVSKCLYCGDEKNSVVPKTEHNLQIREVDSTCTSKGKIIRFCVNENCGYTQTIEELAVAPHKMTINDAVGSVELFSYDGEVLYLDRYCNSIYSIARCATNNGSNYFICDDCGFATNPISHEMVTRNTATCLSGGFIERYCRNCGEIESKEPTPAKGHNNASVEHLCKENNDLTVLYHLNGGDQAVKICYRCDDCGYFVPVIMHEPNCQLSEVTCINPQVCKECNEILSFADHVAPELKCISSKNDDNYYCVTCNRFAMGKLQPHEYAVESISDATCEQNSVKYMKCKCGAESEEEIADSALGHIIPDGCKPCVENYDMSYEYFFIYDVYKSIAYKCSRCNNYFETIEHSLNCAEEDVRCDLPQFCTVCNEVFITKAHIAPEITCCSSKGDEYYYCVVCENFALGRLTMHDYSVINSRTEATCSADAAILYSCRCGKENPDGIVEIAGTALGHKIGELYDVDSFDCLRGHKFRCNNGKCENGCGLNFEHLLCDNLLYCADLYDYLIQNGYYDDYLTDENSGKASSYRLISILQCCAETNFRFNPHDHLLSKRPFIETDYEYNGELYKYVPSTCVTKGSALYECVYCGNLMYMQNYMPLNANNHESEILPCGEHCKLCAPEDGECTFSFTINVLRSNGEPAVVNGLPLTYTYGAAFLFRDNRLEAVTNDRGDIIYYVLSDAFIAQIINANGIGYSTQEAAKVGDTTAVVSWKTVKLYKNVENIITIYIAGENDAN